MLSDRYADEALKRMYQENKSRIFPIGIIPNFFQMWFSIFLTTFTIGFPITIVVTPFVKNIADRITLSETV